MNGLYWGLTALHLMGKPEALPREETIQFVLSCQHQNGGFGAAPRHDAHLLSTVSAIQILATIDALDELEKRGDRKFRVGNCEHDLKRLFISCLLRILFRYCEPSKSKDGHFCGRRVW